MGDVSGSASFLDETISNEQNTVIWIAAISPQCPDFPSNKPSAVSQTALLTGHGGIASGPILCYKKIFQGKGRKGANILGFHFSKIQSLEHSLHGEGTSCAVWALINYLAVTSLFRESTFFCIHFLTWTSGAVRLWERLSLTHFSFAGNIPDWSLWSGSVWHLLASHMAPSQSPESSYSPGGLGSTQILNECLGLTALFLLMP